MPLRHQAEATAEPPPPQGTLLQPWLSRQRPAGVRHERQNIDTRTGSAMGKSQSAEQNIPVFIPDSSPLLCAWLEPAKTPCQSGVQGHLWNWNPGIRTLASGCRRHMALWGPPVNPGTQRAWHVPLQTAGFRLLSFLGRTFHTQRQSHLDNTSFPGLKGFMPFRVGMWGPPWLSSG